MLCLAAFQIERTILRMSTGSRTGSWPRASIAHFSVHSTCLWRVPKLKITGAPGGQVANFCSQSACADIKLRT